MVEIGFLNSVLGNAFQGYTHRRMRYSGRFIGVKTQLYPQVPESRPHPAGSAPSHEGEVQPRRRVRTQSGHATSLASEAVEVQHSLCSVQGRRSCYGERTWGCLRPLLSFDYISLGLGESRPSFKLTSLLPNPSWACAGSLLPNPFPGSSRFHAPYPS